MINFWLLLASTTFVVFLLASAFGDIRLFQLVLERVVSAFGGRALCLALSKCSFSSTLASLIVVAIAIIRACVEEESFKMMAPSGSSGSDSGNWRKYLNFQEYGEEASSAAQNRGPVQEPSEVQEQPQAGPSSSAAQNRGPVQEPSGVQEPPAQHPVQDPHEVPNQEPPADLAETRAQTQKDFESFLQKFTIISPKFNFVDNCQRSLQIDSSDEA